MKASIVMAAYNEEKTIGLAIESVLGQGGEAEIIVVDDGSTDGTAKVASQYPVKLIRIEHRGPGEARNIGIKRATGDVIFLVDADEVLSEKYVRVCLEDFKDPNVVAIFPNYEPLRGRISTLVGKCYAVEALYYASTGPSRIPKVARKEFLLKEVGLFNPELVYAEDSDLFYRMKRRASIRGLKMIREPRATVYHTIESGKRSSVMEIYRRSVHRSQAYIPFTIKYPREGIRSIILPRALLILLPISLFFYLTLSSWVKYVFLAHILGVVATTVYFISRYIAVSGLIIPSLCLPTIYAIRLVGSIVGMIKYLGDNVLQHRRP